MASSRDNPFRWPVRLQFLAVPCGDAGCRHGAQTLLKRGPDRDDLSDGFAVLGDRDRLAGFYAAQVFTQLAFEPTLVSGIRASSMWLHYRIRVHNAQGRSPGAGSQPAKQCDHLLPRCGPVIRGAVHGIGPAGEIPVPFLRGHHLQDAVRGARREGRVGRE